MASVYTGSDMSTLTAPDAARCTPKQRNRQDLLVGRNGEQRMTSAHLERTGVIAILNVQDWAARTLQA